MLTSPKLPFDLSDALVLLGLVLVVAGVALLSRPAALIVAGIAVLLLGVIIVKGKHGHPG
jgi:uncharacterized membrane protein